MNILLDTCTFLWIIRGDRESLSENALNSYKNSDNDIFFSVISSWEIVIKQNIGKLRLEEEPRERLPNEVKRTNCRLLPVYHSHTLEVDNLPDIHSDPFDRLLIAQARNKGFTLLTPDKKIQKYDVSVIW